MEKELQSKPAKNVREHKKTSHSENLEMNSAQLSHDHESMKYRHRLCTHDKMFNNVNVSKRVTSHSRKQSPQ